MEAGIVGLPNVGKSTLFNALTNAGIASENYPFCTIEPNVGVVDVPDGRLSRLNRHIETEKVVPAVVRIVDIAGIVKGASVGEGLGNKFLANIRDTDAILHVVRCFEGSGGSGSDEITHVDGSVDPIRDIETIETELILADMQAIDTALPKAQRAAKSGDKAAKARLNMLEKASAVVNEGKPLRGLTFTGDEALEARAFGFLTAKKVLYVCNVGEDDLLGQGPLVHPVRDRAGAEGGLVVPVCAKLEAELAELEGEDKTEMLEAVGLAEPALHTLSRAAYQLLGLQSYFTAGPKEIKAWTIPIGATAPQAAGVIHSDFEKGFIRAEVYSVDDLDELGSEKALRDKGRLRVEGKEYIMRDGDVCHFLFNV